MGIYNKFGSIRLPHIKTIMAETSTSKEEVITEYGQNYLQKIAQGINTAADTGATSYSIPIAAANGNNANIKTALYQIGELVFKELQQTAKNNGYTTYTYTIKYTYPDPQDKNKTKDDGKLEFKNANLPTADDKTQYDKKTSIITSINVSWSQAVKDNDPDTPEPINFKLYRKNNNSFVELKTSASNMLEIENNFNIDKSDDNKEISSQKDIEIYFGFPEITSEKKDDTSIEVFYSTIEHNMPLAYIDTHGHSKISYEEDKDKHKIYFLSDSNGRKYFKIRGKYIPRQTDTERNDVTNARNRGILTFINDDGTKVQVYFKVNPSPSAPNKPINLTATKQGTTSIKLTWKQNSNSTKYKIYRTTNSDGSNYTEVKEITDVTTVNWINTDLDPNTTYYYKITALNDIGESDYSAEASAKTDPLPPPAPTGVTATALATTTVRITWNEVKNITKYKIYRSETENGVYSTITTIEDATATSYTNNNVRSGRTYYYKVAAVGEGGEGPRSVAVSVTTSA